MNTPTNTISERLKVIVSRSRSESAVYQYEQLMDLYTQQLSTLFTEFETVIGECMSCKNEDNANNWCDVHIKNLEQRTKLQELRKKVGV